ncbi:Tfp pilus assembly protein PilF [Seinonella peptonophila]|uniref:Tfp pilus assembly protein PilF n=1 Tax=Seinonella peptonophila TaxID=112248 RepID=A0A1M4VP20_9BACL|nr:tetratricopeptide repeat protein [Seinonella peptonophila]SHE70678.1 Tfp pilus assembly protein PilF [Seinonella peptonophila]
MAKPVIDAHSIVYIQGKALQSVSYHRIRSRIERMIAKKPDIEGYLELACLEARKQDWDRAQVAVESALQLDRDNPDAQLLFAQVMESKQEAGQAHDLYQGLLQKHPHFSKAHREWGRFLMQQNEQMELAQAALWKSLELNPRDPMAHLLLAKTFIHKNRQAQALLHLEIAERYQEKEPLFHAWSARLWMEMEQYDKAAKHLKIALQYFPRNKAIRVQFRQAVRAKEGKLADSEKSQLFWKKWGFK